MAEMCVICGNTEGAHELEIDFLVPLYKSALHIESLFQRVNELASAIKYTSRLMLVLDGPDDSTDSQIATHRSSLDIPVSATVLSRNFGVGPALLAGLSESSACIAICFGSDLQEPSDVFVEFVNQLEGGDVDIVLGTRESREDPLITRLSAKFFWWINRKVVDKDSPIGGYDIFGINRVARQALTNLPEQNTSITSQLAWIGFRKRFISFRREKRSSGKSSWSFRRKVKLFSDSLYGFTSLPIALITFGGLVLTVLFSGLALVTAFASFLGLVTVKGYTTLLFLVAIGNSAIILCLGIIGGYVWRAFDNTKQRPVYLVLRKY